MRFAFISASLLLACSAAPCAGFNLEGTWQGSCERVDGVKKPPASVTLQMHVYPMPQTGTINGVAVSGLSLEEKTGVLKFKTAGVYKDEAVDRLFDGVLKGTDDSITGYLIQSAGGTKVARCDLTFVR